MSNKVKPQEIEGLSAYELAHLLNDLNGIGDNAAMLSPVEERELLTTLAKLDLETVRQKAFDQMDVRNAHMLVTTLERIKLKYQPIALAGFEL